MSVVDDGGNGVPRVDRGQALIVPGHWNAGPQRRQTELHQQRDRLLPSPRGGDCGRHPANCPTTGIKYYATFWPIPLPGWADRRPEVERIGRGQGVDHLNDAYDVAKAVHGGNDTVVVSGIAGRTVVSNFKTAHPQDTGHWKARTNYSFIGDPQRPSGGFFERFGVPGQCSDPGRSVRRTVARPIRARRRRLRVCATDLALAVRRCASTSPVAANPVGARQCRRRCPVHPRRPICPNGDDPARRTPYGYYGSGGARLPLRAQASLRRWTPNYCQHVNGSDTIYITLPARYLPLTSRSSTSATRPARRRGRANHRLAFSLHPSDHRNRL